MNRNDNLSLDTMSSLQLMLREHHRYSNEFKHAYEILQNYPDVTDACVRLCVMPGQDQRRYNLPTSDEVAVILLGDGTAAERHDNVLHPHSDRVPARASHGSSASNTVPECPISCGQEWSDK